MSQGIQKKAGEYITGHKFPKEIYKQLWILRGLHLFSHLTILRYWYVHAALRRKLKHLPSDFTFVEAGCGNSDYIIPYAKKYKDATFVGVDIGEENIKIGKFFSQKKSLHNTLYILDSIEGFKLKKPVNFISCIGVLHILPNDIEALENMVDNLLPSGELMLYVPINYKPSWRITEWLSEKNPKGDYIKENLEYYKYKPEDVIRKLELVGLSIEEITYTYNKVGRINYELNRLITLVSALLPIRFVGFSLILWFLVYHILFITASIDFLSNNKTGNGMLVIAKK